VNPSKEILILAGPNGAGKTTFAREFLVEDAHCPTFINADIIAAELSPGAPERAAMQAGRAMLNSIRACVARGESFAFETTLADLSYARSIPKWRAEGYHVSLWFLALDTPELAIRRVAGRVSHGGHAVPESVVRRRFAVGRRNFDQLYRTLVDHWILYENSGAEPVLLDWGERQ
jgi:predicted ABC-type ATPase